jgi:peptidylprolyl isomerase
LGNLGGVSGTRIVAVLACLLALSACSSTPSATSTATPVAGQQTNLDGITVTGAALVAPKVEFATPFVIDKTQSKVLIEGSGAVLTADSRIDAEYYALIGRDGSEFANSYKDKNPLEGSSLQDTIVGFRTGLVGQKVGSRVLIAIAGVDGYDSNGGNSSAGINVGDTLIFVVDILDASRTEASGTVITPPAGLPTVTGDGATKPTVTIPAGQAAPTTTVSQTLIEGNGAKVVASDYLRTRWVAYSWKTGDRIDDQFDTFAEGALSGSITGWQQGLVGKTVGSRVLLVLPPKDSFPNGANDPPLEAGDTVVYVIDILDAYQGS